MGKSSGVRSEIKVCGGVPSLYVNNEPFTPAAYMTYLEQYNEYKEFAGAGYVFFSAPVLFAGRWINASADTPAFKKGIFDVKDSPDFSVFDDTAEKIISRCPDALIFPRVNISMPEWWEKENPGEVNIRPDGSSCRESIYSGKWRLDAAEMLNRFVEYVSESDYASHIVGYQIAGGNTEEWFHFDLNAGFCRNAEKGFKEFLESYYPDVSFRGLPELDRLNGENTFHNDEYLSAYLEYASFSVADSIDYFASVVKAKTKNSVVVGTFYGYSLEVMSPLLGTHALSVLLDSKNIDFICSPCSYFGTRSPDTDWTEMYPADSVRFHGKMCFQECDIRTYLTTLLFEKNILLDPYKRYTAPIWKGPDSRKESLSDIRKAFCRQLVKGNGLWWFDMWGGWYADSEIMKEMKMYRDIYSESICSANRKSTAEIAVFVDENAYRYMTDCPLRNSVYSQRKALGLMGTPYDIYDVFDFDSVKTLYKAYVFLSPVITRNMQDAVEYCIMNGLPHLLPSEDGKLFIPAELRDFCRNSSVRIYCETDDIIYINENYAAVCAAEAGEKIIRLYGPKKIRKLIPPENEAFVSDLIKVSMNKGDVVLYSIAE